MIGLIGLLFLINFSLIFGVNIEVLKRNYFLRKLKQRAIKTKEELLEKLKLQSQQKTVGNLARTNKLV